jgi:hypothetical protein
VHLEPTATNDTPVYPLEYRGGAVEIRHACRDGDQVRVVVDEIHDFAPAWRGVVWWSLPLANPRQQQHSWFQTRSPAEAHF